MPEIKRSELHEIMAKAKDNDEATELMAELSGRQCGHCAACCTWLGIQELKKYQGQTCINLKNGDPNKRCGIYKDRPVQCSSYLCTWRIGILPDNYRPDMCGFLINADAGPDGSTHFIFHIFDRVKAGQLLQGSKLFEALQRLLSAGDRMDITLHDIQKKQVVHFTLDGEIWEGKVIPNAKGQYHDLKFMHTQNIGRYETKEVKP